MRDPNILIVAQAGRLTAEALLFAASLRASSSDFSGQLFVAEPQPGGLWPDDPRIKDETAYSAFERLGAEILPFTAEVFGAAYPNGNKVEALAQLPEEPFIFFDSDTLITGDLSALPLTTHAPTASMARTGTWPVPELYGPDYSDIWKALYDRFDLDFASSLDVDQPADHWERYLYFNAGWFTGPNPRDFAERMLKVMTSVRDTPPPELICQPLYPWLDQIALPLAIHGLGGGRPGPELDALDGSASWHYRSLSTIYARAPGNVISMLEDLVSPNWVKKVLKSHPAFHKLLFRGVGVEVRQRFHHAQTTWSDEVLRKKLKRQGFWLR